VLNKVQSAEECDPSTSSG